MFSCALLSFAHSIPHVCHGQGTVYLTIACWLQEWGSTHIHSCCCCCCFSISFFGFFYKALFISHYTLTAAMLNVWGRAQKTYLHSLWIQVLLKLLVTVVVFWGRARGLDWPGTHYVAKHLLKIMLFLPHLLYDELQKYVTMPGIKVYMDGWDKTE